MGSALGWVLLFLIMKHLPTAEHSPSYHKLPTITSVPHHLRLYLTGHALRLRLPPIKEKDSAGGLAGVCKGMGTSGTVRWEMGGGEGSPEMWMSDISVKQTLHIGADHQSLTPFLSLYPFMARDPP